MVASELSLLRRWFVVINRCNDFRDEPLHRADRLGVVEIPRADEPILSTHDIHHDDTMFSTQAMKQEMPSFPALQQAGVPLSVGWRRDVWHAGALQPARQNHRVSALDSAVNLVGGVFNDGNGVAVDVEGVNEPVQSHR